MPDVFCVKIFDDAAVAQHDDPIQQHFDLIQMVGGDEHALVRHEFAREDLQDVLPGKDIDAGKRLIHQIVIRVQGKPQQEIHLRAVPFG
ncbi:hypothetical protein SDC9_165492 [bioreactor metagenome]|uniref:Uncharacterized protein n=1 Tax=bioreactor metagenome TaxID=1076179 RepID=A0A645G1X4_9ZZZZ